MALQIIQGAGSGSGWNCLETPPREEKLLSFGNSRIWILRQENGWSLAAEPAHMQNPSSDVLPGADSGISFTSSSKPEELTWSRYYVDDPGNSLAADLILPDRPLAAQPKEPILIPNGESAEFVTLIPLNLRLKTMENSRTLLSLPSMQLSKTLFGSPDTGEIVYASPLEVHHGGSDIAVPPSCARCDIKVQNVSGSTLDFSRICIRVEYLGLYLENGTIVTDGIVFAFRGGENGSSLSFTRRNGTGIEKIQPPEIPGYSKLIRKSFDFFKSLTSYS